MCECELSLFAHPNTNVYSPMRRAHCSFLVNSRLSPVLCLLKEKQMSGLPTGQHIFSPKMRPTQLPKAYTPGRCTRQDTTRSFRRRRCRPALCSRTRKCRAYQLGSIFSAQKCGRRSCQKRTVPGGAHDTTQRGVSGVVIESSACTNAWCTIVRYSSNVLVYCSASSSQGEGSMSREPPRAGELCDTCHLGFLVNGCNRVVPKIKYSHDTLWLAARTQCWQVRNPTAKSQGTQAQEGNESEAWWWF